MAKKDYQRKTKAIHRFIGVKIIKGFPQSKKGFIESKGGIFPENEEDQPGYQVIYPDGYISWSPKKAFEDSYREISIGCMPFGLAIESAKKWHCIARKNWPVGMFVFKQIPADIKEDIIPVMQSVPSSAKNILLNRSEKIISYTNQMLIVDINGKADSYTPSLEDIFADNWYIIK